MKATAFFGRLAAVIALAGFAFGVAGCNTVAGMGEDINAAGHAIKKAAE
ncbi:MULTISPECIES: entericidin A/B family lipoprotein [Burkholderia]|uniref:Entericidin n=1 Tax=Burkholderia mayonis TaxID=1385591 RepID=A0A1B4FNB2_9BURK|nr:MULTISPECIES: entericidin A/B family lipoprotein [Burkholderia]AOJ05161.1 entericidin [Burkholderia mayonis]KVE37096.1 entericidin [Burkholderia sp. BDU5]KVE44952.1 entericidin [Burkholderia mayonis]